MSKEINLLPWEHFDCCLIWAGMIENQTGRDRGTRYINTDEIKMEPVWHLIWVSEMRAICERWN